MGARFEALMEGVLMAALDSRYTQVGFNLISVQVCDAVLIVSYIWLRTWKVDQRGRILTWDLPSILMLPHVTSPNARPCGCSYC